MEELTIQKTYTKKEAFRRFNEITPTASDIANIESEYNALIDFCGIRELI